MFNRLYETENCKSKVLSEKFNILIGILNENVSIPLILYLSMGTSYENRISTDDFLKCLDLLISYSVRTMICGTFSFKTLNVMNWISSLNNEQIITAEHLKKLLFNLSSKYSFPSDDMFEKSMREINLYKSVGSSKCKYILYEIEKYKGNKELPTRDEISIEHICPQRPSKDWKVFLGNDYDNTILKVDNIGNLTLTNYNQEMSNSIFSKKRDYYGKSSFWITKEIANNNRWDSLKITKRTNELSSYVKDIWRGIGTEGIQRDSVYQLSCDENLLIGTKPVSLEVFEQHISVSTYRELAEHILRTLFDLDEEIMYKMDYLTTIRGKKILSDKKIDNTYYLIKNGLFAYIPLATDRIIVVVRTIVDEFAKLSEFDIKNEISFSVNFKSK